MRILQALVNQSELGNVFSIEPRPYVPVSPTVSEAAIRSVFRLDRNPEETGRVLQTLARTLAACRWFLPPAFAAETERIPLSFTVLGSASVSGGSLASGDPSALYACFPSGWPLKGTLEISLSNPYAPMPASLFKVLVKSRAGTILLPAASSGNLLNIMAGGGEVSFRLADGLSPSTTISVTCGERAPCGELAGLLEASAHMGPMLSSSGMAGLYTAAVSDAEKVAVVAASLASRGLDARA
jgi:hypothetical protein